MGGELVGDYNLAACQINLGSFRVTGFAESDAANVTPMSDLNESVVGADGTHVSVSAINDPRHEATLSVQRNTAAWKQICELIVAQRVESQAGGTITRIPFRIFDPNSGDKVVEKAVRFTRLPDMTFSKSQVPAEFKMLLPSPQITYGANVPVNS